MMMSQQARSESLFYYFRIEDHIPEDHLLRLIDRHIDFAFVRETLKASYSHTGRPSNRPASSITRRAVNDPVTILFVAVLLGSIAMIASYIPARRAAQVDPMVALRYE